MGYLAMRIYQGALPYWKVIERFPQYKEYIDKTLRERYYYEPPTERPEEIKPSEKSITLKK